MPSSIFDFVSDEDSKPTVRKTSTVEARPKKSIFDEFDDIEEDEADEEEELIEDAEEQAKEEPPEEKSFWQSVASHPATQSLLGAARRITYPLDLLKLMAVGSGLSDIDELEAAFEKVGKPFDREKYIEAVLNFGEYIPTQEAAENLFKEKTGVDLAPQDTFSKIIRGGAEIAATGPKALIKEAPKQAAKTAARKVAGGLAGASAAEGAKALGANEQLSDVLGSVLGGGAAAKRKPAKLTGQQAKNAAIAEKHELRKFGGLQREELLKNAIAPIEAQKKAAHELETSSKKAIDKIIADKIPVAKQRAMGVDLQDAYSKAYKQANDTAQKFDLGGKKINLDPVLKSIEKKVNDIQKTAPSLSPSDKAAIKELKKQYQQLSKKQGPTRVAKDASAEQLLDQYKNFNEEVSGIYRKPEFTGSEEVIKNIYGELKNELIDTIEKSSTQLAEELRFANRIYHQTSKLREVEGFVNKAFENGYDPKKLNQTLGSKRNRAFLERDLGENAVQEMQDIARYGMEAEQKVLKAVKSPKTVMEFLNESPLKLSLLFKVARHGLASTIGTPALAASLGYDVSKHAAQRAKGALMLSPKTRQAYSDYLRYAVSPESAAFKKASQHLTDVITDEYGSEEDFLDFLEDYDED